LKDVAAFGMDKTRSITVYEVFLRIFILSGNFFLP